MPSSNSIGLVPSMYIGYSFAIFSSSLSPAIRGDRYQIPTCYCCCP
jgi:hypothetical protein